MIFKFIKPFRNLRLQPFSSFKENMEKKQADQQQQEFIKEIEFLANKPSFTLADFKVRVIDGLLKIKKGLKYKFVSGIEQNMQQMESQKKILNSLYPDELNDFELLKGDQKKEISIVSQQPIQDINKLLRNYEQLLKVHGFLRLSKEKGEQLPQSQDELTYRFRKNNKNSRNLMKFRFKKFRFSKKQARRRVKWGVKRAMG